MPPPSSRMTKNQLQTTRYFPGKAEVEDPVSEEESEEEEDELQPATKAPPPKATSFPAGKKLAVDLSRVGQQKTREPAAAKKPDEDLEGFVTASESSQSEAEGRSDEAVSDSDEEEEESSSDDEPAKPLLRPTFISKAKRTQQQQQASTTDPPPSDPEASRKAKADELLQAQLERDAALRAAGRKAWDDDADNIASEVDDTDDLDHEAELLAWKLRELKRVRRDRLAIEEKEKEREEIERRRNLTAAEREAEDKQYIESQKTDQEGRGKMGFMQKYFHKGAFNFSHEGDEEVEAAMSRSLAGAKFVDETGDKSVLPEYMRIRDMTRLGKKGRTKYKDLREEDTGRWGSEVGRKRGGGEELDERFRADGDGGGGGFGGGREKTGANAQPVGERRRREEGDAPSSKRARFD